MRRSFVWSGPIKISSINICICSSINISNINIISLNINIIILRTIITITSSSQRATRVLASIAPNSTASRVPEPRTSPQASLSRAPGDRRR